MAEYAGLGDTEVPKDRPEWLPSVYFLECTATKLIKIGSALNWYKRTLQHQASSGAPLRVLAHISGPVWLEEALHWYCNDLRHHGEWFEPKDKLLAFIEIVKDGTAAARIKETELAVSVDAAMYIIEGLDGPCPERTAEYKKEREALVAEYDALKSKPRRNGFRINQIVRELINRRWVSYAPVSRWRWSAPISEEELARLIAEEESAA